MAWLLQSSRDMNRALALCTAIISCAACGMEMPDAPFTVGGGRNARTASPQSDGRFSMIVIDVGQGDATLIIAPTGEALLIDAGPEDAAPAVRDALAAHRLTALTAIVATHYHADHIGGVAGVIAGNDGIIGTADDITPTQGVFDRGGSYDGYSAAWESYERAAAHLRQELYPGDRIDAGAVAVTVVAAGGAFVDGSSVPIDPDDENAASIALVIEFGAFRAFVGGDITGGGGEPPFITPDLETPLAGIVGDVDVLKVSHHGSRTSTNQAFIDALKPEIAVISCGDGNDYFHPHLSVVDRLQGASTMVYQTERCFTPHDYDVAVADGSIRITADGESPPVVELLE